MKIIGSILALVIGLSLEATALSDTKITGHMYSLPQELLKPNIVLHNECNQVKIVETHKDLTDKQIKAIDKLCQIAVSEFQMFLRDQNINIKVKDSFDWKLVLLPNDQKYRDLNDIKYRFSERVNWFNDDGSIDLVKGYTSHNYKECFVLDDMGDNEFNKVLTHEIFHALSYNSGLYQSHRGNKNEIDEELAIEFTTFLGY